MSAHAHHGAGQSSLLETVGRLVDRAEALADHELAAATRRSGWTAQEVVVAADLDLQRLLRNLNSPSSRSVADVGEGCDYDPASPAHRCRGTEADHDHFVRGVAAAYSSTAALRFDLAATADAVSAAVVVLDDGALWAEGALVCTGDLLWAWSELLDQYVHDLQV